MKLSDLKQQIEELDAKAKDNIGAREEYEAEGAKSWLFTKHGPELLRRLLVAEEALDKLVLFRSHHDSFEVATAALATIRGEEE